MKLYLQLLRLLFSKFVLRCPTGLVVKHFAESMGIVYIKLAQILATQNYGQLFTEADRELLSSICDHCNPIPYAEITRLLRQEYGDRLEQIFRSIDETPVGSASVSQVHRAVLATGEEVAIKIKRRDIEKTIERDIRRIRRLVHRFGRLAKFRNFTGGDRALDLYLGWIHEETDFAHEQANIEAYQAFAASVNGKVRGTRRIHVPRLYRDYCTDRVIVMEYVSAPTINQLSLTPENKQKIATALNSYIKSSFYAMFHDQTIVFHGDPHSGNVCLDARGDLWFLDMGLLCVLSDADAKLCRQFFLAAYAGHADRLYEMLVGYGDMQPPEQARFRADCERYCREIKTKEVTYYFIDMINICLYYEFVPPNFLFSMAKAFLCLNGISNFTGNQFSARELLREQTIEFMLRRSLHDCKDIFLGGLGFIPRGIENTLNHGLLHTLTRFATDQSFRPDLAEPLGHLQEMLDLLRA